MRAFWFALLLALASCGLVPSLGGGDGQEARDHLHTCPMHPEILQDGPGSCPICGMDLVPVEERAAPAVQGEQEALYWVAPMDPTYTRDGPGKSPMGMDLVPVYADGGRPPVTISPEVRQNMNLRTAVVRRQTMHRHLRTVGEVEVGEDELSVVNLRFSGWAEAVRVERTGDAVRRGQVLFDVYSPELVSAQEEYLLGLRSEGPQGALARSARRKLDLWGLRGSDLDALAAAGEPSRTWPVRSPQDGYVLHKEVVEGTKVAAGRDLYRIGNLQRIWVTAEVYEHDAPWVEVGQPAQMELSYQRGQVLDGTVAHIYPTLSPVSRTLKVRLEFDNPGVRLKPGMFATVHIQHQRRDGVIAVPSEAILHSGHREVVFVHAGDGSFEARQVVTGLVGDRHLTEVLHGLDEGDEVVVSGQFLVDSESQLQEAIAKLSRPRVATTPDTVWSCPMHPEVLSATPGTCPHCGMDLETRRGTPAELAEVHGHESHDHGTPQPGQYVCPMECDGLVFDEPGRCPVCGMFLEEVEAEAP